MLCTLVQMYENIPGLSSSVVFSGRCGHREAAPQTGVVVSAAHDGEAGRGTGSAPAVFICKASQPTENQPVAVSVLLPQALASIKADRGHANDGLSSALLVVFLDSARNLPVSRRGSRLLLDDPFGSAE